MPKIQPKRKVPTIDMTAMVDIGFLLLTFFILTTKFKAEEKVVVDTPLSHSTVPVPERGIFTVTVADDGALFVDGGDQHTRLAMLAAMEKANNLKISSAGKHFFANQAGFGVPLQEMASWLNQAAPDQMKAYRHRGIPADTRRGHVNELKEWIAAARRHNPRIRFAIKGDRDVAYEFMEKVISTLQDAKVDRFNLITSLESDPDLGHQAL